ncbi:MAG TPA: hypothetical protein VFP00_00355 [Burkholderiales bacterium]|nr:hypothetical protein [Burkholderiales bacterium]
MKRFMAVYLGSAEGMSKWKAMDEARRRQSEKAGKEAWVKWGADHAGAIVDHGSPLGKTKRISAQGIVDTRNEIAAWSLVQAESHEAAARLFQNHPHFTIFPGDAIEVMECLPMPEM